MTGRRLKRTYYQVCTTFVAQNGFEGSTEMVVCHRLIEEAKIEQLRWLWRKGHTKTGVTVTPGHIIDGNFVPQEGGRDDQDHQEAA